MATLVHTKLALATVAAVAMYMPTLGLPVPGSCLRTGATASAAPSPSCSSDLRECLRSSARETIYGARYVPAEDVARCVEAFNACIHGGASAGGNPGPTPSTSPRGRGNGFLPQRFTITDSQGTLHDCRVDGEAVSCKSSHREPTPYGMSVSESTLTGTLSGSTVTGTWDSQSRADGAAGCVSEGKHSGPATFVFNPDGAVTLRIGPQQSTFVYTGCEAPPASSTTPVWEGTGTWSPSG